MTGMIDPASRILTRISQAELNRRWNAVRQAMKKRGIDAIVMQNTNDWLGGYTKWFTDLPANNGYPRTVVFHADAPMSVVEMGPSNIRRTFTPDERLHRGVGEMLHTPSFTSIGYTDRDDVQLTIDALRRHSNRTIGLITMGALPYAVVSALKEAFATTTFIDVTPDIDAIKAIKSEEEIVLIRQTARLQDDVFAEVLKEIRPGLRDMDITAIAQRKGQLLGSEQGIFLGG
jgi:Xaa-Pro aminopeptidase